MKCACSLLYLSLVVVWKKTSWSLFFFCHFWQNARILIFSSFWKYIVYSAPSQLISCLLFWNVLYGKTDCCLCIYHGILWCSICQLGFSLPSAKSSILVVSEINLHVCFFGLGFILGLFGFVDFLFVLVFFFFPLEMEQQKALALVFIPDLLHF